MKCPSFTLRVSILELGFPNTASTEEETNEGGTHSSKYLGGICFSHLIQKKMVLLFCLHIEILNPSLWDSVQILHLVNACSSEYKVVR